MFCHELKYAIKTMLKNKTTLIWTLLFPIILGTFMYMAFGSLWKETLFETIPIAIVKEQENKALETMLEQLSKEGEQLLQISYLSEQEAKQECGRCLRCDCFGFGSHKGGRTNKW